MNRKGEGIRREYRWGYRRGKKYFDIVTGWVSTQSVYTPTYDSRIYKPLDIELISLSSLITSEAFASHSIPTRKRRYEWPFLTAVRVSE